MIFSIRDLSFELGSMLLEGWPAFAARAVCALLILLAAWLMRRWLTHKGFPALETRSWHFTGTPILLRSFAVPVQRMCTVVGIYLAASSLPWAIPGLTKFLFTAYKIATTFLLCQGLYNASEVADLLLASCSPEIRSNKTLRSLLDTTYKVLVVILGVATIAQESGFPIGSIVAGAGLIGLTISLAAQESASNLFSGIVILLDKPFSVGDWITVGDVEGEVIDINFRSTKVRALDNSVYILTNSTVSSASTRHTQAPTSRRMGAACLLAGFFRPREEEDVVFLLLLVAMEPYTSRNQGQDQRQQTRAPAVIAKSAEFSALHDTVERENGEIPEYERRRDAAQIHRHLRPVDPGGNGLDERQQIRAQHGGDGEEEREADRERPVKPAQQPGGDRRPGPGQAGYDGDHLRQANDDRVRERHGLLGLVAVAEAVGRQQQKAGHDEREADEKRVVEQRIQPVVQQRGRDQRQRGRDQKQQQPPPRQIGLHAAPQLFDVEHGKPLAAQPAQLRMIRQNDRPERPEMQQNVKQHLVFQIPDAQEVLQNGEMAGAGDRQKLRKPLYDTK